MSRTDHVFLLFQAWRAAPSQAGLDELVGEFLPEIVERASAWENDLPEHWEVMDIINAVVVALIEGWGASAETTADGFIEHTELIVETAMREQVEFIFARVSPEGMAQLLKDKRAQLVGADVQPELDDMFRQVAGPTGPRRSESKDADDDDEVNGAEPLSGDKPQ